MRQVERDIATKSREEGRKEPYHEPLLIKHEPLRDITGQKYDAEKPGAEKFGIEKNLAENAIPA